MDIINLSGEKTKLQDANSKITLCGLLVWPVLLWQCVPSLVENRAIAPVRKGL